MPLPRACRLTFLCLRRLLLLGLNSLLGLTAVIQALCLVLILGSVQLELPPRISQALQKQLTQNGLPLALDALSFDFAGNFHLTNLRLFSDQNERILTCHNLLLRLDPVALLIGNFNPLEIMVAGLQIHHAPVTSNQGGNEAYLQNVRASLAKVRNCFHLNVEGLAFSVPFNLHLSAPEHFPGIMRSFTQLWFGQDAPDDPFPDPAQTFEPDPDQPFPLQQYWIKSSHYAAKTERFLPPLNDTSLAISLHIHREAPPELQLQVFAGNFDFKENNISILQPELRLAISGFHASRRFLSLRIPRLSATSSPIGSITAHDLTLIAEDWALPSNPEWDNLSSDSKLANLPRLAGSLQLRCSQFLLFDSRFNGVLATATPAPALPESMALQINARHGQGWVSLQHHSLSALAIPQQWDFTAVPDFTEVFGHPWMRQSGIPDYLPRLHAADFDGSFFLDPEGRFSRINLHASLRDLDILTLPFQSIDLQAEITPTELSAHIFEARAGQNRASGEFLQDFQTLDYRLRLAGQTFPPDLNPLIPDFWDDLWTFITPGSVPVQGETDISGRWGDPDNTYTFSNAMAHGAAYQGVPTETASLYIITDPELVWLHNLQVQHADGQTTGDIRFFYPQDDSEGHRIIDILLDARLPATDLAKAFGGGLAPILQRFQFDQAPQAQLRGRLERPHSDATERETLRFNLLSSTPFLFDQFSFQQIELRTFITTESLAILPSQLGLCSGEIQISGNVQRPPASLHNASDPASDPTAKTAPTAPTEPGSTDSSDSLQKEKPPVPFNLRLQAKSLQFACFRELMAQWDETNSAPPPTSSPKKNNATDTTSPKVGNTQQSPSGQLDFELALKGLAGQTETLQGDGVIKLREADLGSLHLFGGLSRIFAAIGLPFASFDIRHLTGDLLINQGRLFLKDGKLTGPRLTIETNGSLDLTHQQLDFALRVFLLSSEEAVLSNLFGFLLKPFGHALPIGLRGTLDDPQWRLGASVREVLQQSQPPTP